MAHRAARKQGVSLYTATIGADMPLEIQATSLSKINTTVQVCVVNRWPGVRMRVSVHVEFREGRGHKRETSHRERDRQTATETEKKDSESARQRARRRTRKGWRVVDRESMWVGRWSIWVGRWSEDSHELCILAPLRSRSSEPPLLAQLSLLAAALTGAAVPETNVAYMVPALVYVTSATTVCAVADEML